MYCKLVRCFHCPRLLPQACVQQTGSINHTYSEQAAPSKASKRGHTSSLVGVQNLHLPGSAVMLGLLHPLSGPLALGIVKAWLQAWARQAQVPALAVSLLEQHEPLGLQHRTLTCALSVIRPSSTAGVSCPSAGNWTISQVFSSFCVSKGKIASPTLSSCSAHSVSDLRDASAV